MDTNLCRTVLADGRIRLADGAVEMELMLDTPLEELADPDGPGLVCKVSVHSVPEGARSYQGVRVSEPEYTHCYVVATGEEISEGATIYWQNVPVLKTVAGELVNAVRLRAAAGTYGSEDEAAGDLMLIAGLRRRVLAADEGVKCLSGAEQETAVAAALGVTVSLLRRACRYEAALGAAPAAGAGGPMEPI